MRYIILFIHIIISFILVGLVLLQSSQGGLLRSLSGSEMYRSKRGAEKLVFIGTIVLSVLFFLTSVLNLLVK